MFNRNVLVENMRRVYSARLIFCALGVIGVCSCGGGNGTSSVLGEAGGGGGGVSTEEQVNDTSGGGEYDRVIIKLKESCGDVGGYYKGEVLGEKIDFSKVNITGAAVVDVSDHNVASVISHGAMSFS